MTFTVGSGFSRTRRVFAAAALLAAASAPLAAHHSAAMFDDEKVVDIDTTNREIDVRADIALSKPLGIASWQTKAAVRLVRIRSLTPAEVETSSKEPEL